MQLSSTESERPEPTVGMLLARTPLTSKPRSRHLRNISSPYLRGRQALDLPRGAVLNHCRYLYIHLSSSPLAA